MFDCTRFELQVIYQLKAIQLAPEDNEHLGLIVSGQDEEVKNIDENIKRCRSSLFSLLGAAFSFKSKVSPKVQLHLWRTYCQPVLRSGLAGLPLCPIHTQHLTIFHHKVLRGFLKLSSSSPIPALHSLAKHQFKLQYIWMS